MKKYLAIPLEYCLNLLLLIVLGFSPISEAASVCSSYRGKVVFNEVYDPASGTVYLEIKTLDPGVVSATSNFAGWQIDLYKDNVTTKKSTDLSSVLGSASLNNCGQYSAWIRIPDSLFGGYIHGSNPGSNLNFVMFETAGKKIVDILRLGAASSFYGAGTNYTNCDEIETALPSSKYDAAWGINGNKDWYRTPDGTGNWGGQSNSNPGDTVCGSNNGGGTLGLSKVSSVTTTTVNTNFSYTLYVQNGATGSALSGVQITDNLNTAGLTFVSCTTANGTCTNTGGIVTWNIGAVAVSSLKTATLTVSAAAPGTLTNTISANTTGSPTATSVVTITGSVSTPAKFSAYESSVSDTDAATLAKRIIQTRVATTSGNLCKADGTTCSLKVAAFTSGGAVDAAYAGTVSASLQYCSNVSRSGATVSCGGTWADLTSVTTQSLTLASGVQTFTFPFANNAYEVVRVKLTSTTVSGGPWYADDYFAIRPGSFTVTATDATASTAGSTRSLTGGANAHNAGKPFTLNAQALATASTASNYPGTGAGPVAQSVTTSSPTGTNAVNGTLVLGTWSGTGTVTSSTATYSEVGVAAITLQDQDYANIDAGDGSTTTDRYFAGSASLNRFTPDHFDTVITQGCVAGGFTYSGQPFAMKVTAMNGLATPATTANYDGSTTNPTPSYAKAITLSEVNGIAGSFASPSILATAFTAGIANVTPTYTFTTKPTAPSIIKPRVTDADSITSSGGTEGTVNIYSGRLKLGNAYGSELLNLSVPLEVQYWTTALGWTQNSADVASCTSIVQNNIKLSNTTVALNSVTAVSGSAGKWNVNLTKPGVAANVDICVDLGADTAHAWCAATTPLAKTYLQTGAGYNEDPVSHATFGVYKGNNNFIYQRESY